MATGKRGKRSETSRQMNMVKFFHKNVVEQKPVRQCAREMEVSERTLHNYKKADDFRRMAIEYLENSDLKGLGGTMTKLVNTLDATKPVVTENADGSTSITRVPDNRTRMAALQEVIKIYGLHAPQRRDTKIEVTFSSDAELHREIEEAERICRSVESYEVGKKGPKVAPGKPEIGSGDLKSKQRTLLQVDPVPESQ